MAETEDKVRVKFLRDEVYETEGRNQGRRFTEGRTYSLTPDLAQRWIRREAAELVDEPSDDEGEEPPKPRRGRPPKAKPEEAGNDDEDDEDVEPAKAEAKETKATPLSAEELAKLPVPEPSDVDPLRAEKRAETQKKVEPVKGSWNKAPDKDR